MLRVAARVAVAREEAMGAAETVAAATVAVTVAVARVARAGDRNRVRVCCTETMKGRSARSL